MSRVQYTDEEVCLVYSQGKNSWKCFHSTLESSFVGLPEEGIREEQLPGGISPCISYTLDLYSLVVCCADGPEACTVL